MAMVAVEVRAVVPVMSTGVVPRAQVAGLVAPFGPDTAQVSATFPVNPPVGATVTTEVLPVVAPAARVRLVGRAVTVMPGVGVVDAPLETASIARV